MLLWRQENARGGMAFFGELAGNGVMGSAGIYTGLSFKAEQPSL